MTAHACPYDGARQSADMDAELALAGFTSGWTPCGSRGFLCDRCCEDRADRRTRALVEILNDLTNAISERP